MKKVFLTGKAGNGKFALVDDEDFERVSKFKWHLDKDGYAVSKTHGSHESRKSISMHRFINNTPIKYLTDHRDLDKLNNQKSNLRNSNSSQNTTNQRKSSRNTSGYKGVFIRDNKYIRARINVNGKNKYLGYFNDLISAAQAYNDAAIKYHGEFAQLNPI